MAGSMPRLAPRRDGGECSGCSWCQPDFDNNHVSSACAPAPITTTPPSLGSSIAVGPESLGPLPSSWLQTRHRRGIPRCRRAQRNHPVRSHPSRHTRRRSKSRGRAPTPIRKPDGRQNQAPGSNTIPTTSRWHRSSACCRAGRRPESPILTAVSRHSNRWRGARYGKPVALRFVPARRTQSKTRRGR